VKVTAISVTAGRTFNHPFEQYANLEDDERQVLIDKIAELERVIDAAGGLSDWINQAKPIIRELMLAYERRIRSLCSTPEELAKEPWRCAEYIGAERLLEVDPWGFTQHVCGLQGFGRGLDSSDDNCPACSAPTVGDES